MKDDYYYTVNQLCERIQISQSTAYRWIKSGLIEAVQIGKCWKIPSRVIQDQTYLNALKHDKIIDGYLVVMDTGIDEKDDIYPFVFPDQKSAILFIKDQLRDDDECADGPVEYLDDNDSKCKEVPYNIIPLNGHLDNYNPEDIRMWNKITVYTTLDWDTGDNDVKQDVWYQLVIKDSDANSDPSLINVGFIDVCKDAIIKIRLDFYVPDSIIEKYNPGDIFEDALKLYCLEMVHELNNNPSNFTTNGLHIPAEEFNRVHEKVYTKVADKYKDEAFIKLFESTMKGDNNE